MLEGVIVDTHWEPPSAVHGHTPAHSTSAKPGFLQSAFFSSFFLNFYFKVSREILCESLFCIKKSSLYNPS